MTTTFALDPRHGCHISVNGVHVVTVLRSAPRAYREQVLRDFGHKGQAVNVAKAERASRAQVNGYGWTRSGKTTARRR